MKLPTRPPGLLLGGLMLGVSVAAACGGGDGGQPATSSDAGAPGAPSTVTSAPAGSQPSVAGGQPAPSAGGSAAEILALLDRGRSRTFHARYVSPPQEGEPSGIRFELWNKPPFSRLDVVLTGPQGLSSSAVRNASGSFRCARQGDTPWACQAEQSPVVPDPAAVIFDAVREGLAGKDVTVEERVVRGRAGRCFADVARPEEAVCVSAEGIPLRILSGGRSVELELLEDAVADRAINPPAKPSSA